MKPHPEQAPREDQERLLVTRADAAAMLGCSTSTIIRLQREGRLRGVRLSRRPTGQVYFSREQVFRLVKEADDAR